MKYSKQSAKFFSKIDFKYLNELKNVLMNDNKNYADELLENYSKKPKNGLIIDIEKDIKGFYNIENNGKTILVVKNDFKDKSRNDLLHLIINRIDSINDGEFDFPESIYENKIIQIEYNREKINVNEIRREDFEYILFMDENGNYYVNFLMGKTGFTQWKEYRNKVLKNKSQ